MESPTEIGSTEKPVPTGVFGLTGDSGIGWPANLLDGQPVLGYRLTDGDGVVVVEGVTAANWERIDGTGQCGGNRLAEIQRTV